MLQSPHGYLAGVVLEEVLAPVLGLLFSIFVFTIVVPAEVLPAEDLPLSLLGEERSSGVAGGGDLREPEPTELVGDKPQWSGLLQ